MCLMTNDLGSKVTSTDQDTRQPVKQPGNIGGGRGGGGSFGPPFDSMVKPPLAQKPLLHLLLAWRSYASNKKGRKVQKRDGNKSCMH